MKDRSHDEAMAELFKEDPMFEVYHVGHLKANSHRATPAARQPSPAH